MRSLCYISGDILRIPLSQGGAKMGKYHFLHRNLYKLHTKTNEAFVPMCDKSLWYSDQYYYM